MFQLAVEVLDCGALVGCNQVVDLQKQLSQFLEHKAAVSERHGQTLAEEVFSDAVYIVSVGSNDYLGGYFGNPKQREKSTPEQFVGAVVTGIVESIKVLINSLSTYSGDLQVQPLQADFLSIMIRHCFF